MTTPDVLPVVSPPALALMPVWLRVLGVVVCFLPPVVYAVMIILDSDTPDEAIGGILWTLILSGLFLLIPLIVYLLVPLAWLLGWRPGALAGSLLLALIGLRLSVDVRNFSVLGLVLGPPLDLHFLLIGMLLWEWKRARHQQKPRPADVPKV